MLSEPRTQQVKSRDRKGAVHSPLPYGRGSTRRCVRGTEVSTW